MPERVTQKEVADRAGVAQATVSLLINGGRDRINADTARRIDAAIEDLGYLPNPFARALRTNRTMALACVVPDLTNPYYPSLVSSVQRVARSAGYEVLAVDTSGDERDERRVLASALQGRLDGIVGVFFCLGIRDLAVLGPAGVPIVRIEASVKTGGHLPIDSLYVDNFAAAKALTQCLLDLGHRDIVFVGAIGGPQAVRREGYLTAMAQAGAAAHVQNAEGFTLEFGREATSALLAKGSRPTALIAANDLMAIGAMQALREAGLRVPNDLSVAGFDDIMASALVSPALSTVRQHQDRLGARAAERLLSRFANDKDAPGEAEEMPFEIVMRASVAGPRPDISTGRN